MQKADTRNGTLHDGDLIQSSQGFYPSRNENHPHLYVNEQQ